MFWIVFFVLAALILFWPHWFGVAYENEVMRFIWRLPPFTVKVSHKRLIILFFNHETHLFSSDKRRRKAVTKRQQAPEEPVETQASPSSVETTSEEEKEYKEVFSPTDTPMEAEVREEKAVSQISSIPKSFMTPLAEKTDENENDDQTQEKEVIESQSHEKETRDESSPHENEEPKESSEESSKQKEHSFFGFRLIRKQIIRFKKKMTEIWEREKGFVKANWRWFLRFLKTSFRLIKPITFRVKLSGGFEDPAMTGTFFGFLKSLSNPKYSYYKNYIDYTPDFMGQSDWKYEGDVLWRTSIAALIWWIIITLLTFPYYQAYKFYKRRKNGNVSKNS